MKYIFRETCKHVLPQKGSIDQSSKSYAILRVKYDQAGKQKFPVKVLRPKVKNCNNDALPFRLERSQPYAWISLAVKLAADQRLAVLHPIDCAVHTLRPDRPWR
jgi:hypothetical protein